ncbi:putative calcium-binding protein CML47 [Salvia divinorum]|uniref:Calcium-binding protein CML47 n=1 Tax=Salvia divinorum TaxID=28513 RepID=A0ABD1HDY5_SALDI
MSSTTSLLTNAAKDLINSISFILWCIPYSLILTIQDFSSCFRRAFHLLYHRACLDFSQKSSRVLSTEGSISLPPPAAKVTGDDVGVVMRRLRLPHREPFSQDSVEDIQGMFERAEPLLDEVREAFRVFDENDDGFVDAEELKKVMSSLGLVGLSQQECERMIMVFDDDGDGRISFGEFVKIIEESV